MERAVERTLLYGEWRAQPGVWAPLICAPALGAALAHFEGEWVHHGRVLDLGCGQGQVIGVLANAGMCGAGIDRELAGLQRARRFYPRVSLAQGDIEALPFADAAFDALFSFSVFQYLAREKALAECARILRPGGRLICVENLAGNPIARAFRLWSRLAPISHSEFQRPQSHLAWGRRRLYEHFFSKVEYQAFHVTVPALVALPSLRRARVATDLSLTERWLYEVARRLDALLLRRLPWLRGWAWHGLICAVK